MNSSLKTMSVLVFLFAGLLLPTSWSQVAETPTSQPTKLADTQQTSHQLRVGTWNLLNLFDNYDHPTRPDEGTAPKSYFELMAMAKLIDSLNVDVLGVQEVENREILEQLNRCLKRPFAYVELIEGNDHRGIDVGILSRLVIKSTTSHRHQQLNATRRFSRDFPVFSLALNASETLDVGVVHLKSKRGKKKSSDGWRHAEAKAIANILRQRQAQAKAKTHIMLMGDFNDYRDSMPLAPLMNPKLGLVDPSRMVDEKDRFTFVYRGKGEQIDFLLHNPEFRAKSARIYHPSDNPSDHSPLVVNFQCDSAPVIVEVAAGFVALTEPQRPQLKCTDLKALRKHLLQEVCAKGKVVKVYRDKGGNGITLNFADNYRKAVCAYFPKRVWHRFSKLDFDALLGQTVELTGPVSEYRGATQIVMTRPQQLKVVSN